MAVTVAVDAMGGDHGPAVTLPAALAFLEEHPDALRHRRRPRRAAQDGAGEAASRRRRRGSRCAPATEVVDMDEPPADALRRKKDSSMRVAINLVHRGEAQACVSAGNTGALMAIARFVLKTLPGIDRPAIASQLPTQKGVVTVLDLGANVNCSPEQLVQFAAMGSALVSAVDGIERPTVGPAQHRRGGHQGQRRRQAGGGAAASAPASTSTATSRATTSTRARPTSSSATASSATSR